MNVQPDDKVMIAGSFTMVNGIARNRIARLNRDGSLDDGFNPPGGLIGVRYSFPDVNAVSLQADGKIVVGGYFTSANGTDHKYLVRFLGNEPPQFTSLKPSHNGTIELAGYAATNAHLRLETSTNLSDWSAVDQFTNFTGAFSFTNHPTGTSCGFYRMVWLP